MDMMKTASPSSDVFRGPLIDIFRRSMSYNLILISLITISSTAKSKDLFVPRSLTSCADFISVEEIGFEFAEIERVHEDIAHSFQIGTSVQGRPIYAITLSSNPQTKSMGPKIRIIGGIHGNECMGVEITMLFVRRLINAYNNDPFYTRLLDNAEISIIPVLNPDGYSAEYATRNNADNVDLNRNLHFAWTDGGPFPFSEPETKAFRDFSEDNVFSLGISYHTVANYVNAPWNYTPHHPPDKDLLQAIGNAYANDSDFFAVFGWDWFNIQGDINDWSLGVNGTFDWTLELMSDTDNQWSINEQGLRGFLSFAFQGIHGIVTDADTGIPLRARIEIFPSGAPVFTEKESGNYNRILLPGIYDVVAVAQGYKTLTIKSIEVKEDAMAGANFELIRDKENASYAFKVAGMTLPRPIPTSEFVANNPYLNATLVWNTLGPPDGKFYSLSSNGQNVDSDEIVTDLTHPIGSITLDMGIDTYVIDQLGADLKVVSGTESNDPAAVLVAEDLDGPFVLASQSVGSIDVDIHGTGLKKIRYVRIVDLGSAPFNDSFSGYDLDAVINLTTNNNLPIDGGDNNKNDTEESDAGEINLETADSCGCIAISKKQIYSSAVSFIRFFLHRL